MEDAEKLLLVGEGFRINRDLENLGVELPWYSRRFGIRRHALLKQSCCNILSKRTIQDVRDQWMAVEISIEEVFSVNSAIALNCHWSTDLFFPNDQCQYLFVSRSFEFPALDVKRIIETELGKSFAPYIANKRPAKLKDLFPLTEVSKQRAGKDQTKCLVFAKNRAAI